MTSTVTDDVFTGGIPHAFLDRMRREAPVVRASLAGTAEGWHVFAHRDVVACLHDWETFSSRTGGTTLQDQSAEQVENNTSLLHTDPPEHTRLRRAFHGSMTRRSLAPLRGAVDDVAEDLVRTLAGSGSGDGVVDVPLTLAARMANYSLCAFLGIPARLRDHFMRLSALMLADATPAALPGPYTGRVVDPADARLFTGSPSAAMVDMLMRYCFDSDRDDEFGHGRATATTEREVEEVLIILATAGTGMTQNAVSMLLWMLAEHWDALVTPDGELTVAPEPMIEECLRLATPLMHVRRTAVADTVVGGERVGAGEKVILWFAAADFDPDAFDRPREFDPARSPNPHVAFGRGAHFCLGAHLARLEMRVLLDVVPRLCRRVDVAGGPRYLPSNFVNEMLSLPLRFDLRRG